MVLYTAQGIQGHVFSGLTGLRRLEGFRIVTGVETQVRSPLRRLGSALLLLWV